MKIVDARGLKCPMPIVKAKKEVDALLPGESLEVRATDPGSVADFKGWAKTAKNAQLTAQREEQDEQGRTVFVHVLERKA